MVYLIWLSSCYVASQEHPEETRVEQKNQTSLQSDIKRMASIADSIDNIIRVVFRSSGSWPAFPIGRRWYPPGLPAIHALQVGI
jgi:hypothetical protein